MFAFSLNLWDRRSPNGLFFWHARCLTHACKEWCSCSYKLHIHIHSMSTVNWSTNVILQSTSIHGLSWIHLVFRSPSRSNPHRDASTTGSHISSFRSLRWSAWLCLIWRPKVDGRKVSLSVFFSATENPTSWMFPKRSKRFCLCAWLQGPKGREGQTPFPVVSDTSHLVCA